jgi:excinuclease UvrABC ATPase subunit
VLEAAQIEPGRRRRRPRRWLDLGPGAGHDGGRNVFEGTPADLVAAGSTLTGEHLAAYVETSPLSVRRTAGSRLAAGGHPVRFVLP